MNEQEFDAAREWRSFGAQDGMKFEQKLERLATLGLALWGRTPDELRRQLTAEHPTIPTGCSITDLQDLLGQARTLLSAYRTADHNVRIFLNRTLKAEGDVIEIGSESFTVLEARHEVARRAIEWLENRGGGSSSKGH